MALLGLGAVCSMAFEHDADRRAIEALTEKLSVLEHGLAGEFDALDATLRALPLDDAKGVGEVSLSGARNGRVGGAD